MLDAFCAAFNAADRKRLTALLLDSAVVEVVGATTRHAQGCVIDNLTPGAAALQEAARSFDATPVA